MKRILQILLLSLGVFLAHNSVAQIDTEFWFAAPELTEGAEETALRDRPIYLVLSSFDQTTEVEILQPANLNGFEPIEVTIDPFSTEQVNLTDRIDMIESRPANEVLSTGILVRSSEPINAYYEIRSPNNTDLISLKGKNALGEKFYLPFQTLWDNDLSLGGVPYLPPPRSGFVVMATDDSTTVEITPPVDLLGHPANITFTVFLHRGETYFCEASGNLGSQRPAGTFIESDKPITVTTKDDMIDNDFSTDGGADVAADQMISYEWAGTEHIVMNSNLSGPGDQVYLLATENNTEIYLNGADTPEIILNEGEQYVFGLEEDSYFIESSEKIYVWHIGGIGDQIAGAAIPALECTGSNRVSFVRSSGNDLYVNLTIRSGSEDEFTLNGDPGIIQASDFETVPGSDGDFVFARIQLSTSDVPAGSTSVIENDSDELFHMGITNRSNGASANYGYFTNFSYLNIGGSSTDICLNDSLELDAGPGKTEYSWNTGDTTQRIIVTQPGMYIVETFSGTDCFASDTINVNYYEPPIDLGEDQTICEGDSITLEPGGSFFFTWQDSSTAPTFTTDTAGLFWVQVTDFQGCTTADSIQIATSPRPETPEITGDTVLCEGDDATLTIDEIEDLEQTGYRWVLSDGTEVTPGNELVIENVTESDTGYYYASYLVDGCRGFADSVHISVNPVPQLDLGDDVELCDNTDYTIDPVNTTTGLMHEWNDGSSDTTLTVSETDTYSLEVENSFGCTTQDQIQVTFTETPDAPVINGNLDYCSNDTIELTTQQTEGVTYTWFNPEGDELETENGEYINEDIFISLSGTYSVIANIGDCFSEEVEFDISINPLPQFTIEGESIICEGDSTTLTAPEGFASYEWSTGESGSSITVSEAGDYELTVTNDFGCQTNNAHEVEISDPSVEFTQSPEEAIEPDDAVEFEGLIDGNATSIETWLWEIEDHGEFSGNPVDVLFDQAGFYQVMLTATDGTGCSASTSREVTIAYPLTVPTVFTPNNDGQNDLFIIQGLEVYDNVHLRIFNRWGELIFEDDNYRNYWDAQDVSEGTYFYTLEVGDEFKEGSITILR